MFLAVSLVWQQVRLPQFRLLHEGIQPPRHGPGLSPSGRRAIQVNPSIAAYHSLNNRDPRICFVYLIRVLVLGGCFLALARLHKLTCIVFHVMLGMAIFHDTQYKYNARVPFAVVLLGTAL